MNATATLINNDPIMTLRVLHAELDQVGNMTAAQQWLDTEAQRYDADAQEVAPLCA